MSFPRSRSRRVRAGLKRLRKSAKRRQPNPAAGRYRERRELDPVYGSDDLWAQAIAMRTSGWEPDPE